MWHDARHIVGGDRRARRQNREPLDQVRELAYVAGPGVRREQLHRTGVEAHRPPQAGGLADREVLHQRGDVVRPLSQWRNVQGQDVEPEQQVLAELPLLGRFGEVLVGRRDDAHVYRDRSLAAEPLDHAGLEHAQQLRLRLEAQVADLIQEQGPAIRQLEAAHAPLGGAREGAALVAEHLGLHQILRDGGAVHAYEALRRASALAVDG